MAYLIVPSGDGLPTTNGAGRWTRNPFGFVPGTTLLTEKCVMHPLLIPSTKTSKNALEYERLEVTLIANHISLGPHEAPFTVNFYNLEQIHAWSIPSRVAARKVKLR